MATFDLTMPEVWYPIPGVPGYEMSSHIRVRTPRGKMVVFSLKPKGYLIFHAVVDRRSLTLSVHHVIAELAHGPRPPGLLVLHKDDVKTNNHPDNLYYGTMKQNCEDGHRNGRLPRGSQKAQAKLEEQDIPEIRRLRAAGLSYLGIARIMGVNKGLISMVCRGLRWTHVP